MSDLKNIVIIGASSGAILARALEKTLPPTHRIVLIDANECAYWPIGALRGAVVPGQEEKVFARLDTFFPRGSRHVVLNKTKVTAIWEDCVTVDRVVWADGSNEIPIDYAVIATGSIYGAPCRPASTNTSEAKAALQKQQRDIAAATSIVIIGGGPCGVEMAGEILNAHPGKKVTLVTCEPGLLGSHWIAKFPVTIDRKLKSMGCRIIYNVWHVNIDVEDSLETNVLLPSPRNVQAGCSTIQTDFLFLATGGRPNVELVPEAALENGHIAVDSALRVTYPPLAKRYFSMGDASSAEGLKTYYAAGLQTQIVAAHILGELKGRPATKAWKAPEPMLSVPLGPKDGATLIKGCVLGGFLTGLIKGRNLLNSMFKSTYHSS